MVYNMDINLCRFDVCPPLCMQSCDWRQSWVMSTGMLNSPVLATQANKDLRSSSQAALSLGSRIPPCLSPLADHLASIASKPQQLRVTWGSMAGMPSSSSMACDSRGSQANKNLFDGVCLVWGWLPNVYVT